MTVYRTNKQKVTWYPVKTYSGDWIYRMNYIVDERMMGVGYTGGKKMPQYEHTRKFAWRPVLTTSGKWIWWRHYVKLIKIYWGPAGEDPVIDAEFYTEGEWLLEEIKNNYSKKRPAPPKFAKSAFGSKGSKTGY